jgi:integrase
MVQLRDSRTKALSEYQKGIAKARLNVKVAKPKTLPEYLEPREVEALILQAAQAQARLIMLTQWRAGLRISEALKLRVPDLSFDADNPTVRVGEGKGRKPRYVPMHPELGAAFRSYLDYSTARRGPIFHASRSRPGAG